MNSLESQRQKWYQFYFDGDTTGLATIEVPEFRFTEDGITQSDFRRRYSEIEDKKRRGQWFPGGTKKSENISINYPSKYSATVKGAGKIETPRGRLIEARFEELWVLEEDTWKVASLTVV